MTHYSYQFPPTFNSQIQDIHLPPHFPQMQMQPIGHVHHNAIAMSNHQVSTRPNIINMISPMQSQQVPYQVIPKNTGHNPHVIPSGRSQAIADQHHFVSAPYAMHNQDLAYNHQLISDERRRGQAIAASVQRQNMVQQAPGAHHNHTAPPQFHTNHHPVNEAKAIHYPQVITNTHQFVPAQYAMHNAVPSPMFGHDSLAVNQHGSPAYSDIHHHHNVPIRQANMVDPRRSAPAVYTHHQHAPCPQNIPVHYQNHHPMNASAIHPQAHYQVQKTESEVLKKLVEIQISNNFVQVSAQLVSIMGDEGRDKIQDFFTQFDLCTQNWAESDKIRLLKGKVKGKASKSLNAAIQKFGEESFNVLKTEILSILREVDVNEASAFSELNHFGSRHPNEDIVSFANRTQKLVTCSFPHLNESQLDETSKKFFIANLQDENLARFLECQSKNSQSFDELVMVANKLEMLDKVKLKARIDPHPDIGYYHQEIVPTSFHSSHDPVPNCKSSNVLYPTQSMNHLRSTILSRNSQNIHYPRVSRANAPVNNHVQWNHPETNNVIQLSPSPETQQESPTLNCGHISAKDSPDFLEIFQELESMNDYDYESSPLISNKEISPKFSDKISNSPTSSPAIPPHSPNSFPALPNFPLNSSQDIPPPSIQLNTLHVPPNQNKSHTPNEIIEGSVFHSPPNIPHKRQRKRRKKKGRNVPISKGKKVEPSKNSLKEKSKEKVFEQMGNLNFSNSASSSLPESNKLGGTSSHVGGGKASAGSRFIPISHRKEFSRVRVKDIILSDQVVGKIPNRPPSLLAGNLPKPILSRPPSLMTSKFPKPILSLFHQFPMPLLSRPQSLLVGNFPNPILFNSHHSYQAPFGPSFACLTGTIRT